MTSVYAGTRTGVCPRIWEWELGGQFQFSLGGQREKKQLKKRCMEK